jgi:pimeloyl-ACP methyl ester carboxylesterase
MAEDMPGDPGADGRFVRLVDGDMHVVEDGTPGAPGLLLIHGSAGSTAWWDPVVPALAGACRVIRVDLLGHGRSSSPPGGYDIPAHARRVGAALDRLGAGRVTVIGHSMGCMVATALAEQRPDKVAALALIDMARAWTLRSLTACSSGSCWPSSPGGCCGACGVGPPSARPCAPPSPALSTSPAPSSRPRWE